MPINRVVYTIALVLFLFAPARADNTRQLWLYYPTNLQVNANVPKLEAVWRRAATAGYSHILLTDSKFAKLGDLGGMDKVYFANVERVKKIAGELHLEIVPAVFDIGYSNNMLWHDPNLAEGLPAKDSLFVVKNGEARLVADPPISFKAKPDWKDDNITLAGGIAIASDFKENSRLSYKLAVPSYRCYHISVKIKTQDFQGQPQIAVLAGNRALQYQNLGVAQTQDWKEHHVIFNSLNNKEVNVYFGVWGGGKGSLQWKDWKIEEVGLLNVLRRPGTPCVVQGYVEGKDYEPIREPRMGNVPYKGEYEVWHEPPTIKCKAIPDGTKLRVSWYHPAIIYDGQVSACISEPKTMELLADQARRMKAAWGANGYMMSHDEFRTMNQDEACQKRHLDAGEMLAENAQECTRLLAGSTAYVWSDMFDPFHNAHKDYYLVRGDLTGSWNGLDKSVIIMNWNFDKRDQSLKFFADRGHQQIIAGYYDGDVNNIKKWLGSAAKVKGIAGVMYTTWRNDFSNIEAFAKACRE